MSYLPELSLMSPRPLCLAKGFKKCKEKNCYTGMSSAKSFTKMVGPRVLALYGDAEGAGLFKSGEEMVLKEDSCSPCVYGEGAEEMETSSLH